MLPWKPRIPALRKDLYVGIADAIERRLGVPIYPVERDSIALSIASPKTAALAFDKVYRVPYLDDPIPEEIGFYCATNGEISLLGTVLIRAMAYEALGDPFSELSTPAKPIEKHEITLNPGEPEIVLVALRVLGSAVAEKIQRVPTILYPGPNDCQRDFPTGKYEVLTASISNIALVDEANLNWSQILEFRKDPDARNKYRRFVRWVDAELKDKTPEEVEDLIAIRLDDYEWAVRKHGMKNKLGTLSTILEPKFLSTVSVTLAASAFAGAGIWTALVGGALVAGKALLHFGTTFVDSLDEQRKTNYEVAYVYDIKSRLK